MIEGRKLIHKMPFMVSSADADMNLRLRMGALTDLLIQSAIQSADGLQAGFADLKQYNMFWVLSRISIQIARPLKWYDSGSVETWPKNRERVIYLRDFILKTQADEIVGKATSGWLAVDIDSKRPRALPEDISEVFCHLKDIHALQTPPEKLMPLTQGDVYEITVTYFDIDLNGHVTSSRYVDWMMDTFSVQFHQSNWPSQLSVNYVSEVKIHESIQLRKQSIDERTFLFEGFNMEKNTIAFLGKIMF